MSIARHHAEWLSLIEVSGPFFSLPVIQRAFKHGLNDLEPGLTTELRAAYADWQESGSSQAATHQAWVQYVLQRLLGFAPDLIVSGQSLPPGLEARVDTFHETLRPDFAILPPADRAERRPVLLVRVYPPAQRIESPLAGAVWKASPAARMMSLLHATDLPLGLVTNGEEWQLVFASKNESTGFASWYADLWLQEPITLRAFQSMLSQQRFFGVADEDTPAALLRASLKDQHEVTNSLGAQVRQAVELLVRDFDRLDIESGRRLLDGLREPEIYNASLTVMMRLVFLFCAEERGLLRLGEAFYDQHYAVSTLREQLRETADQRGEEVLERRSDAWCRLLATFRAVHGGVAHDAMRLPAYGGTLFDPDRFPFLEGRAPATSWSQTPSQPPHINNRVVLHLLEALQILRIKLPGGGPAEARRLSFRSLDIEQIGHVYEGLLDHTARRAPAITLGLEGSSKSPAPLIALEELETLAAGNPTALLDSLEEVTGRSRPTLEKALGLRADTGRGRKKTTSASEAPSAVEPTADHTLSVACAHDPRLISRVRPFASLMRRDSFDQLVLIPEGSLHVAPGNERRSTGTHYTPRTLTEPIVQHTLEPLVYHGPAEGLPQSEWTLRSPKELLALKICDMAMGSGAFLVQVCRYLAERLVEAWQIQEKGLTPPDPATSSFCIVLPDGSLSHGHAAERLLPADPAERIAIARRYVADRCLYGVDINPMAVEMAKLSLWLITLQRDRPFTFLDHALKCGDSLLGVTSVQQIENFSLRPGDRQITFATANLFRYVEEAAAKRRALEDLPSNDHAQIEIKQRLHAEAEAATAKVKAVADCLIAFELRGLDGDAYEDQRSDEAEKAQMLMKLDADASPNIQAPSIYQLTSHASDKMSGRRTFHWAVEFPEVFSREGFDAFVGNPPFVGGLKLETLLGHDYRAFLVHHLGRGVVGVRGTGDLCAYFFLRVAELLRKGGTSGLIATNTIAQGDSRRLGLDQLTAAGFSIFRAVSSRPWPGTAALEVSHVWLRRGKWSGCYALDDLLVTGITAFLIPSGSVLGTPFRLSDNSDKSFTGSFVMGLGFLLTSEEATTLISNNPRNRDVVFPYLNGEDLNSTPNQQPSRWIICFHDWSLEKSETYSEAMAIVRERVKPERDQIVGRNAMATRRGIHWWRFAGEAKYLYEAVANHRRVLICTLVSKYLNFAFVPAGWIYANKCCVFAAEDNATFTLLQSTFHEVWTRVYGSTLETRLNYSPTDCFETFPFPKDLSSLESVGASYHENRSDVMRIRQEGLTKTYNRFHDLNEQSEDIVRIRALRVELDKAVAAAYGWDDLELGHGFHATKQGERYTLSETARRTVLDRLLALNHQRYAEELAAGLHDKKKTNAKPSTQKPKTAKGSQPILPDDMRLPATEALLYTANLIVSLLSEAGGGLRMTELAEAFYLVTNPALMVKKAKGADKELAKAWAARWNEPASPDFFLPTLRIMGPGNISADPANADDPTLELLDGPKPHAHLDLAYDAWLALRIASSGKPTAVKTEQWKEIVAEKDSLFAVA